MTENIKVYFFVLGLALGYVFGALNQILAISK